jgi:hypothetical protein
MTFEFALTFSAFLLLMCLIAAWLFRTSAAPLWQKISVPAAAVALCCYAPYPLGGLLGFPVQVAVSALPDHAELVAFVAHDEEQEVDLWLRTGDVPRAYETRLTPEMKKTLREAREAMEHGRPATLAKRGSHGGKNSTGDQFGSGEEPMTYELDESAMSALQSKE